jgi:hypothetical protein
VSLNPNFAAAVARLYPSASFQTDVIIEDHSDGRGPQLIAWRIPNSSPPTDDQIATIMATPVVPQEVTMLQGRLALRASGLISQADAAVALASPAIQDMWQFSTVLHRDNAQLLAIAQALSLTSDQVDALFISAAAL